MKFWRSAAMLMALFAGVFVIELLFDAARIGLFIGQAQTVASEKASEKGAEHAYVQGGVPAWFEEELLPLEGYDEIRVDGTGSVIGFTSSTSASETIESVITTLQGKGWAVVDSEWEAYRTFVKDFGVCTWAAMTCVDVGGSTSVVFQCSVACEGVAS